MSVTGSQPLRVEFTILDGKLHREEFSIEVDPAVHLFFSTLYEDAVSAPFPDEGKQGLSIFMGRSEQFLKVEVPLLWNLEKKRGRQRMAVVTNLQGKGFAPAFRKLESSLGDSLLVPLAFLRRRGEQWDSLDFFSSGHSKSMEGAAPRLKRLKQRGWEQVVDCLAMTDPAIKELYFETLHVERPMLQEAFLDGFAAGRVSAMVGIAGQCLQKQHLGLFLQETMMRRVIEKLASSTTGTGEVSECWHYLSKRRSAKELLLMARGEKWLDIGHVLKGASRADKKGSEFQVSRLLQRQQVTVGDDIFTVVRVAVDWRYPPHREIPVKWAQNSTSPAGSQALSG